MNRVYPKVIALELSCTLSCIATWQAYRTLKLISYCAKMLGRNSVWHVVLDFWRNPAATHTVLYKWFPLLFLLYGRVFFSLMVRLELSSFCSITFWQVQCPVDLLIAKVPSTIGHDHRWFALPRCVRCIWFASKLVCSKPKVHGGSMTWKKPEA